MAIHIAPIVLHVRVYDDSVNVNCHLCDMTEPYLHHLVITINDIGVARIQGLHSTISLSELRVLNNKLWDYGVRKVSWRHRDVEHLFNIKKRQI